MSINPPIWGVDVSSHQGSVNWQQVYSEGFRFGIAKATEGTYYKDAYLARNLEKSKEHGMIPGAYHFLTNENVTQQINKFLSAVGDSEGKLIALDCEDPRWYKKTGNGQPTVNDVWNAIHLLREKIGNHPILIYSGNWWWSGVCGNPDVGSLVNGKNCRLWVSRYVTGSDYASRLYQKVPKGWWEGKDGGGFGGHKPTVLQFSESAKIAGQKMDANAFAGTIDELRALATMSKPNPKPERNDYYVQIGPMTKETAQSLAKTLDGAEVKKGGLRPGPTDRGIDKLVDEIIAALRPMNGARYAAWKPGTGDVGPPLWANRMPTAKEIHDGGAICTTVTNCFMHKAEVKIPAYENWVRGGTGVMGRLYHDRGHPYRRGIHYKRGTLFGSPYRGPALKDQGHVAVAIEDGENPLVMQEDTGYGWNARRRLYETDDFSNFTYACSPEMWLA